MRTDSLNYDLPAELIAQTPAKRRDESRLLVMERPTGAFCDRPFGDIVAFLRPKDCLVLNNTKVLPARFFARRATGARVEGLFLEENTAGTWEVMLKNAGRVKEGETISLCDKKGGNWATAKALSRLGQGRWELEVDTADNAGQVLEKIGFAPLPPYIKRATGKALARMDVDRYQTVYAQKPGAVAAPTAGLHFTTELLDNIQSKGVRLAYVTLHVGAGTFKPVSTEYLADHKMHSERFSLCRQQADIINDTIEKGGRIIAVGTTSVRTLETVADNGKVNSYEGSTKLFIQPGYEFKIVEAMVTNFHLPQSTLLALVSAFAGLENVLSAYRYAIDKRYRFYSYGDAMLII